MINLLPPIEKQEIFLKKKLKLILIFETASLIFLLVSALIFLVSNLYLGRELSLQQSLLSQKEVKTSSPEAAALLLEAKLANDNLQKIAAFYPDAKPFFPVLEKVFFFLPEKSYLTNFSFHREGRVNRAQLTGFAVDRDDLLKFKEGLEKDPSFKNVSFPPTNWVKPIEIDFSFSLEF